ncbi:hypothetical protein ACG1BZ_13700 [Microbulbifer sp. CNSA002]|uniref:hypothetical protein n=1 Tax=Microbulbifer sp. CNSA002 TaxID=3373604 RepID=UPI0039B52C78
MNRMLITLALIIFMVLLSAAFGYSLHTDNPDGIWLYTPPADGSGKPSNALYVGASLGALLSAIIYSAGFVSVFGWSKLKHTVLPVVFVPMGLAALVSFTAMLALAGFAE